MADTITQDDATPTDNFEAAFEELTRETPAAAPVTPVTPVVPAPETPVAAPTTEGATAPETPAVSPAPESVTPATPVAPAPEVPKADADTMYARLAELLSQPAPAPASPAPEPVTEPEPAPLYTADELQVIENYRKEWGEVETAQSLIRRGEMQQFASWMFSQLNPVLTRIAAQAEAAAATVAYQDLATTIPDYDTLRNNVITWANEQPAYLRAAYQHVISNGSKDEIVDLIQRYQRDTGTAGAAEGMGAPSARTPAPAAPASPKSTDLPDSAKQAAAALAPISSKRSVVPKASNEMDFDAAFKEFAAT